MRKFIVVGVGGSGGATVRYLMDQLSADLRTRGIEQLPAAWQFLQVDVNPRPDSSGGLDSIRDLGGRYVPVSASANTLEVVRRQLESRLETAGHLSGLLGWAPEPRAQANNVAVTEGAGQYRAVGRMLTLTRLDRIQSELQSAWQSLQQPTAWESLPQQMEEQRPFSSSATVVPIVIGSMAGGSGASMFLDVCRVMGRVGGLQRTNLGVFLFTPDVFHALPPAYRVGIDGNAMATLAELIASQTRAGDDADNQLMTALGLAPESDDQRAFGRVFPIGASIGGDGAKFGDSPEDVFRGLGRAIAATMLSENATQQYLQTRFENQTPPNVTEKIIGWGAETSEMTWGSFGYSSLSLGRDRYAEYVAQRLARLAVDRLVDGYKREGSTLPPQEQLQRDVSAQWETLLRRLQLPVPGTRTSKWMRDLLGARAEGMARDALGQLVDGLQRAETGPRASDYLRIMTERLSGDQAAAASALEREAYGWTVRYATDLEGRLRDEVARVLAHPRQGLPYARKVLEGLTDQFRQLSKDLESAPSPSASPLRFSDTVTGLGHVDNTAEFRQQAAASVGEAAAADVRYRVAHLLSRVSRSVADDVLPALQRALVAAQTDLESAMRATGRQSGLAQLHTTSYGDWPAGETVPPRFEHAYNEVLLTTADGFPATFRAHVEAGAPDMAFADAVEAMVEQIVRGKWEDQGAARNEYPVLVSRVRWRSAAFPRDEVTDEPTPASTPDYSLAVRPSDLLERAAAYAARKDHHFAQFSNQTFEAYLNEPGLADSEQEHRRQRLRAKFSEAVHQAYPLVGVSDRMVEALHGSRLQVELTFSEVPLAPGTPAAKALEEELAHSERVQSQSVGRLTDAFTPQSSVNKIAIYGSYPKYFPLVFTSVLDQLKDRWAGSTEEGRRELWKWKRTRPLPAALAMSKAEQAAMVRGWYLGRALGLVTHPAMPSQAGPVQVYDVVRREWKAFPDPLLTAREQMTEGLSWLPSILEGHTLAVVQCSNDVAFSALQPYRALRQIHHRGSEPASGRSDGETLLADWLRDGAWPSGHPSEIDAIRTSGATPDDRAEALAGWLMVLQTYYEKRFVVPPDGPGVRAVPRLRVATVDDLLGAHMDGGLALMIREALVDLREMTTRALERARPTAGGGDVPQF